MIVATFAAQLPVTPAGKPVNVVPVAPVVAYVMFVIAVLTHSTWLSVPTAELNAIELSGVTVIVPVAFTAPQPPVSGML